jgi:hypothetical protein
MNEQGFEISVDFQRTNWALREFRDKHIPFVAAKTLTDLARESVDYLRDDMDKHFAIRSKRMKAGVRFIPARKEEFYGPDFKSTVMELDEFMLLHIFGGKKMAQRHEYVSNPSDALLMQGARTATGKIKKSKTPASFIAKSKSSKGKTRKGGIAPKPFIMRNTKSGEPIIAQRMGTGRQTFTLYSWHKEVVIKKVWPFEEGVVKIVNSRYEIDFANNMTDAINTAHW